MLNELSLQLYNRALKLLSIRPRSEKELRERLTGIFQKKHIPSDIIVEQVITHLKDIKFLDDRSFAEWWVRSRKGYKPKGKIIIRQELLRHGIDRDSIDIVLNTLYSAEEEQEQASLLAMKRMKVLKTQPRRILQKRLYDFLLSRGFSHAVIRKTIDEILKKGYNTGILVGEYQ